MGKQTFLDDDVKRRIDYPQKDTQKLEKSGRTVKKNGRKR